MNVSINVQELIEILDRTPATHNVMLVGNHGIGKSRILTDYYQSRGYRVVALFLGQLSDPGDLIGLPMKNEKSGRTEFMPPYWFPIDNQPIVLFLDELNRARQEVLQSVMDLSLNRTLAGRRLPDGSRIISAVNEGEEYQLTDLDPALVSRFNIYQFRPTEAEWLLWAAQNGIDTRVTTFLENNPTYIDGHLTDDMANLDKTPDRRAWERVSDIIKSKATVEKIDIKTIAGIVGAKAAARFAESIKEDHIVDGKSLLLQFEKVLPKLQKYGLTELSVVNDNFYRFLQVSDYKPADEKKVIDNAAAYIDWLLSLDQREPMAHFISDFQSSTYPQANIFIINKCPDIYQKIMTFIMSL